MSDGRYLLPEFDVKPDGNRCRLTIIIPGSIEFSFVMEWGQLEELFADAVPFIDPGKASKRQADEREARRDAKLRAYRADGDARGREIVQTFDDLKAQGYPSREAWAVVSEATGLPVSTAKWFASYHRRLERERLVEHVRKLLKQGRTVRDVAAGLNLPKSTVWDIASQGQQSPSKARKGTGGRKDA